MLCKNICVKFVAFSRRNGLFIFFLLKEALRRECLNEIKSDTAGSKSIWYIVYFQINFNEVYTQSLNRYYLSKFKRKIKIYLVEKYLLTKNQITHMQKSN